MKCKCISAVLIVLVSLIFTMGCATTTLNLSPRYKFTEESLEGVALFSIHFNVNNLTAKVRKKNGTDPVMFFTGYTIYNPLDWKYPRGRLVCFSLPEGEYEMYDFVIHITPASGKEKLFTTGFDPIQDLVIPFRVEKGKVSYLGSIDFEYLHVKGLARSFVSDKQERDIPLFLSRYPNFNSSMVSVTIQADVP